MKVVMCVNDWPEDDQNDFIVFHVLENESDQDAIERAKLAYSPDNQFYITKVDGFTPCDLSC